MLIACNEWSQQMLWPKVYVKADEDEIAVYTEHTIAWDRGVTDAQLDLQLSTSIGSSLGFFREMTKRFVPETPSEPVALRTTPRGPPSSDASSSRSSDPPRPASPTSALALAEALGGEVVNADAMQLYRGMDIGTAKLPVEERRGIPHHLLDVLDPHEDASVADYQARARTAFDEIEARGHRSVAVGGSGLYVRALLDHMEFPGTDPDVRAALEARVEAEGARALHAELAAVDPVAAEGIGPRNARRIVRALEVIALTGRQYSASLPQHVYEVPAVQIGLDCDRAVLDDRIAASRRADAASGLVDEVEALVGDRPGPDGVACRRVRRDPRDAPGRAERGRGVRRDRGGHAAARAQADGLVRPRPARALAGRAGPATWSSARWRLVAAADAGDAGSGHRRAGTTT